ncbi:MAG: hypothetical protein WD709_00040 [Gammaproteobacteria bacterium]
MYIKILFSIMFFQLAQGASAGVSYNSMQATASASSVNPVELPEIITRCKVPEAYSDDMHQVKLDMVPGKTGSLIPVGPASLTLIKQGNSYDVLIGPDSLADNATLINTGITDPIHLIIENSGSKGLEHLLFDLNLDGSGELLWSSAAESALTTCVAAADLP